MIATKETHIYRNSTKNGQLALNPKQREKLLKPYLPSPPVSSQPTERSLIRNLRHLIKTQIHILVFTIIHTLFSLYIRVRQIYHLLLDRIFAILYYHHRAPELIKQDVRGLSRLPTHLSVILELKGEDRGLARLDELMDEVAEIAAWCACVGIPMLSVYEKTGILKGYIPTTHRVVSSKLHAYYGRRLPSLQIRAPHMSSSEGHDAVPESTCGFHFLVAHYAEFIYSHHGSKLTLSMADNLSILLLSAEDSRSTLVDLTKTLSEMSQRNKLSPEDISLDLIDTEITESVMGEPDLLVLFGPYIELQGYPPWQVRLTEIFHVQDNVGVGYQVFLRALHSYAKAQMRFGR